MHWKKKLDALFDRGVVRSSELDDRTLDALDGARSAPNRRVKTGGLMSARQDAVDEAGKALRRSTWKSKTTCSLFRIERSVDSLWFCFCLSGC